MPLPQDSLNALYSLAEAADDSLANLVDTLNRLCRGEPAAGAARELTAVAGAVTALVREAREAGLIDFELTVSRSAEGK